MLTEKQKKRIREEEIFRREVVEILSQESKSRKTWALLNSPIVLWFLSTIIVGVFTFSLHKIIDLVDQSSAVDGKLNALELEIRGRISQFELGIFKTLKEPKDAPIIPLDLYYAEFINPPNGKSHFFPLYAENENRGIPSLITELALLKEEKAESLSLMNLAYSLTTENPFSDVVGDTAIFMTNDSLVRFVFSRWTNQ